MSNLPHPLGDSTPGDLFYPGSPSVVAADAPGAAGSRAVEFGEDGLSAAVNRAVYALAKNDEYQEERLEEEIARPDLVTFTPAGGNGGNYTFSARVWCGDTFYMPEDQSMREALISVLDTRYNDLIDPITGDKIVVKEILDAPAGVTQVGTGFVTNPYITFRKMHPVTGALGADYVIPDGTKVWLAFGRSATLDTLTTDTNVRDAWFRGFTRSIGEIHAASFLHDGSRKATGSFYMDSWAIQEAGDYIGYPNVNITVRASGALGTLTLESVDSTVRFMDNWLSSPAIFNLLETGVVGDYGHVLGELNSKTRVAQAFFANRCLDRAGTFTVNGATGQIDWPALNVSINGESKAIAAGNIVATPVSVNVLVVDATGTVVDRLATQVKSTDIPLFSYFWANYISTFTKTLDVRWMYHKNSKPTEVTVGDVGVGGNESCDFNSGQLREAIELVSIFATSTAAYLAHRPVLRVVGNVYTDDTIGKYTLWAPIKILGDGRYNSTIHSSEIIGDTVDLFDCAGNQVVVEDLTIMHTGDEQTVGLAAFKNAGSGSRFRNLAFKRDAGTYDVGFDRCFSWSMAASAVTIEEIYVQECRGVFLMGSSNDFNTAYLTHSTIRDCQLGWGGLAQYAVVANGDGNEISHILCNYGLDQYAFVGGNNTFIEKCLVDMYLAANADHAAFFYHPLSGAAYGTGMRVKDCYVRRSEHGIHVRAVNDTLLVVRVIMESCDFSEVDKPFSFGAFVATHASSSVVVDNCYTYDTVEQVAIVNNLWSFRFTNNVCYSVGGMGVWVGSNVGGIIANNTFEGYGSAGTYSNCIRIEPSLLEGLPIFEVTSNFFGDTGAPASTSQIVSVRRFTFTDNVVINGAANTVGLDLGWFITSAGYSTVTGNMIALHNIGIYVRPGSNGCRIEGNQLVDHDTYGIYVEDAADTLILGNNLSGSAFQGIGIFVYGSAAFYGECTQIIGNHFRGVQGIGDYTNARVGVIYVQANAAGACPDCLIDQNHIYDCGSTSAALQFLGFYYIYSNAIRTTISGNHIRVMKGYATNGLTVGIRLDAEPSTFLSYSQVIGNNIRHNMNDGQGATTMYGIEVVGASNYIGALVALNTVDFHGSNGSGAGKTTRGIYIWTADDVTVIGNTIPDWTLTGSSKLAIDDTFGTSNIYVANRCRNGNVSLAANKPSQVAYSANGNTPRGDFNTASSGF